MSQNFLFFFFFPQLKEIERKYYLVLLAHEIMVGDHWEFGIKFFFYFYFLKFHFQFIAFSSYILFSYYLN